MSDGAPVDPWVRARSLPMGTVVLVRTSDGREWKGAVVPPHEMSGDRILQLKLASGYNVGIRVGDSDRIEVVGAAPTNGNGSPRPTSRPPARGGEGWVALLTTGGTIASRVDYRTGGVRPVREESEILGFYPDLDRDGPVRVVPVFDRLSEEIGPPDWEEMARRTVDAFSQGARGVVIAHGTDTLAYTSAALSFLLENLPGPVVVVGAQRSPDRPSSDGFTNMAAAVRLARHPEIGEVVVVMHDGLSDDRFAIHRGTRVRKMHSSRRDAFRSRNGPPIGWIEGSTVHLARPFRARSEGLAVYSGPMGTAAAVLWFQPGLEPSRAEAYVAGAAGVIIAGTGLGHVALNHLPWIRAAIARGTTVAMTTQCLEGVADPFVYATGRELSRAGVVYLGDMLPETAYTKLLWALGRSQDPAVVRDLLLAPRAGEVEPRHDAEDHP
ncbi:MAG TPA: Glu-tRNA(Gln) amidotransferase subunit GatD [Thermoplasmata archaeon]|nr:Glu-tRNA(Gln) amidotransferase subunit GatD [Thermoplasmata archaeon]